MRRLLLATLACGPLACTALVGLGSAPTLGDGGDGGAGPGAPPPAEGGGGVTPGVPAVADAGDTDDSTSRAPGTTDGEAANADGDVADALDAGDAGPRPLVPGASPFVLAGITSSGFLLYEDPSNGCYTVSVTGGAPQFVAPVPTPLYQVIPMSIQGRAAFVTGKSVTAWTASDGPIPIPGGSPLVSTDGTRLAYVTSAPAAPDASTRAVVVMEVDLDAALSNPITLATGDSFDYWLFVTGNRFVFANQSTDGVSASFVDSYTTGGLKTHLWDVGYVRVAGGETISWDAQSGIAVRPADGGPVVSLPLPVDAGAQVYAPMLTPDGSRVLILDTLQNFWSSPTASASLVALPQTGGLANVPAPFSGATGTSVTMSPDGSHFLFQDKNATWYVASTTAGHAVALHAVSGGPVTNVQFSNDPRYVLFNAGPSLQVASVDTATPVEIAADATCEVSPCWRPAHDSKVVYASGGDLWAGDVASGNAGNVKLARSVSQFVVDAPGVVAAYRFEDSVGDRSGLYAVVVP
ncbi:MAG TPA: hypothetical protein VGI39_30080 [Polyangiaceae bacterium]|jgi:hypothetical protein